MDHNMHFYFGLLYLTVPVFFPLTVYIFPPPPLPTPPLLKHPSIIFLVRLK